ncbi:MAG TPA: phage tail protein, partial [Afipia sp.]|nr:phage tail protein [Afipia sp.]
VGLTGGAQPGGTSASLSTGSATTGITITNAANTGGGGAHNNVQPTIICNYIMRII